MNKIILSLLLALTYNASFGQSEYRALFDKGAELSNAKEYEKALDIFREIHVGCEKSDPLYPHLLWNYTNLMHKIVKRVISDEQWEKAYEYSVEGLAVQGEGENYFSEPMHKATKVHLYHAVIASCLKLNKKDAAAKYRDTLYNRYKLNDLPEDVNTCFYFDFFKLQNTNAWGVEFFKEPESSQKENMKIIFFIYEVNLDGSEGDMLYTLDLMQYRPKFDQPGFNYRFVMRQKDASGKSYDKPMNEVIYTSIDYDVIMRDVREILKKYKHPEPVYIAPPIEIGK